MSQKFCQTPDSEQGLQTIMERYRINPSSVLLSNTSHSKDLTPEIAGKIGKCIDNGGIVIAINGELIECSALDNYHRLIAEGEIIFNTLYKGEFNVFEILEESKKMSKGGERVYVITKNPYDGETYITKCPNIKAGGGNEDDPVVLEITKNGVEKTLAGETTYGE